MNRHEAHIFKIRVLCGLIEIYRYTRDVYCVKRVTVKSYIVYSYTHQSNSDTANYIRGVSKQEDCIPGMIEAHAHGTGTHDACVEHKHAC